MWQPSTSIANLSFRAKLLTKMRQFFDERNVLEVETPLLSYASVTDPHIASIPAIYKKYGSSEEYIFYLQTSPEYAMKRLLAAGSGPIFQICKAFRQGDQGACHNPEFTILEWYRPEWDHHALMNEMDLLLQWVLQVKPAERISYASLFEKFVGLNPHLADVNELMNAVKNHIENPPCLTADRNFCLDLLLTHCIEPHLGKEVPLFLYDFPISQAALAKIRHEENPPVASRFEVYFKGVELANGFHELQDAREQRRRFEHDLITRKSLDLPQMPIDEHFLSALAFGLPDCSGVALGVDRLIMLAMDSRSLKDTLSFSFKNFP